MITIECEWVDFTNVSSLMTSGGCGICQVVKNGEEWGDGTPSPHPTREEAKAAVEKMLTAPKTFDFMEAARRMDQGKKVSHTSFPRGVYLGTEGPNCIIKYHYRPTDLSGEDWEPHTDLILSNEWYEVKP